MYQLTLSGMPVFDILQPGRKERTYNNPLMDCSSMGESHDRLRDGNRLKTVPFQTGDDCWSLDLGFPLSDDDQMADNHNQPQPDMLDMQFPALSDDDQSNGEMLELGFPPESDIRDVLDLGFDIDVSDPAGNTDGALEMGFDTNLADDSLDTRNNIVLDENPLEMGFDMDPAHADPDRSLTVIRPDPIGFVIQRAVGDLRVAMHQLDMDQAGDAMSLDEAFARQQVLDCTQELLLACQLISISRLST
ncbi:hypothetical protein EDB19DRAFT_1916057 [Suillus lakei]|nr:hypothetical protein EDB19DRAFT_1916057 [Suillus lakei]